MVVLGTAMASSRSDSDRFFRYLPEEASGSAFGLSVSACGWTRVAPGSAYPPGGHPPAHAFSWESGRILRDLQVVVVSRGRGVFESPRGRTRTVDPGGVMLLLPGVWHRYRPDPAVGWDEHWIELRGRMVDGWLHAGLLRSDGPLLAPAAAVLARVAERLRSIADLAARHPPGFAITAAGEAAGLVADLLAGRAAADDDPAAAALRAACCRLAARPDRPLSVAALVAELGIPERTLRRLFIAATGLSPKRWHARMRVAHAERLIAGGCGVGEAAAACGYRSRSAFHRRRQEAGRGSARGPRRAVRRPGT
jgi:AraC-like DNA-binding protein